MSDAARPLPSRERQRAETRERIFEAAVAEFRRAGVAPASIDRIAKTAGVVRGSFYFHFPTKEHVLLELRARSEQDIVARLAALRAGDAPLAEALHAVVGAILDAQMAVDDPRLTRDALAMYVRQPVTPDARDDRFPLLGELVRHCEAAVAAGTVRADLAPERTALMFLTSMFGFLATALEDAERRAALDGLVDVFLRGVAP
jgi:AcrR family transcriptional regulator